MKKQSIVSIVILMLIFSVFISCSDDDDRCTTCPDETKLVGSWELTTIKADGEVVDPNNDTYNLWSNGGIQTFKDDGTGTNIFSSGDSGEFTWSINSGMLEITTSEGTFSVNYKLDGDTLTLSQPAPSVNPLEFPDLELIYTRV